MKKANLSNDLIQLIRSCNTLCDPQCCGLDAYSFSSINIAYHFCKYNAKIDLASLEQCRNEIINLKNEHGMNSEQQDGIEVVEMNQQFRAAELDKFIDEILHNMMSAIKVSEIANTNDYENIK